MISPLILSVLIFTAIYLAITTEKAHKTFLALIGATALIVFRIIPQDEIFSFIDFNTITLLISMMVVVIIVKDTGLFQWLAIKAVKLAKGEPLTIMLLLAVITAIVSAFLDNVTTVLVISPITFLICEELGISPIPFLITQAIASNIGGTATLIGDPPNIMIGNAAHIPFVSFINNLTPVIIVVLIAFVFTVKYIFRDAFHVADELKQKLLKFDEAKAISNPIFLRNSVIILVLILAGFLLENFTGFHPSTTAMIGAAVLLFISKAEPETVFKEVEWATIFFFMGLFVIVGGLVRTGAISIAATYIIGLTKGNEVATGMVILWCSAFLSAIIDNIPYVATMIPMVHQMGTTMPIMPLWWALSLGACLGGNGTLIGASANVVVAGLARKNGHKLTFGEFFKYGFILMIESMIICTVYMYVRYYWLKF
jgi:Na+/H+ antiporter NhaD/arsenite permease-like protein